MATFNHIQAVWRNGPGVVSDAPDWARGAIEAALEDWLPGQDRDGIGSIADRDSGLVLWIFASPSARGCGGGLEDALEGSFVHVVASDRSAAAGASIDEARRVFASVYGPSLSDAALRQQRSYMLLEFPYHRALATDWFVPKDEVEERATEPALEASEPAPAPADGLPFDQGLSYQEVVAKLADAALRKAREAPDSIPKLVPAAGRIAHPAAEPSDSATRVGSAAPERAGSDATSQAVSLSSLLGGSRARRDDPVGSDGLPFDQGLSYAEVLSRLADAVQGVPGGQSSDTPVPAGHMQALQPAQACSAAAPEPEILDFGRLQPPPLRHRRSPARDASSPIFVAAGFVFVLFAVMGVIALQLSLPPTEARLSPSEAPAPVPAALEEAAAPIADEPATITAKPVTSGKESAPVTAKEPTPRESAREPDRAAPPRPATAERESAAPAGTPAAPRSKPAALRPAPAQTAAPTEAASEAPQAASATARVEPEPRRDPFAAAPVLPAVSTAHAGSHAAEPEASGEDTGADERIESADEPQVERRRRQRRRLLDQIQRYR